MLNTAHSLPKQHQLTVVAQSALKILQNKNASTAATCYSIIPVHVQQQLLEQTCGKFDVMHHEAEYFCCVTVFHLQ